MTRKQQPNTLIKASPAEAVIASMTRDQLTAVLQLDARTAVPGIFRATEDALRKVMQEGVKVFQAARDRDGYAAFAKAVQRRGAEIKAHNAPQEPAHA